MDGVEHGFFNSMRRGHVVGDTGCCTELRRIVHWLGNEGMLTYWKEQGNVKTDLPDTDNLDEKVTRESGSEHLRHDEHIGSQRRLQHNRHVGGIEKFDRI
jgi:hypothetical protein